jgi:hypothetical protein
MSEFITLIVTVSTILLVLFFSFFFVKKSKNRTDSVQIDLSGFEDRVLELVSKFQHISATRLSSLENKINEMNKLMREANDTYFKLSSILSDASKILTELEKKNSELDLAEDRTLIFEKKNPIIKNDNPKLPFLKNDNSFTESVQKNFENLAVESIEITSEDKTGIEEFEKPFDLKNSSLEHKILNLSSEGMDAMNIAKTLGVGKGEVDLVLGLFKRKFV